MSIWEKIGNEIRRVRTDRGWTQSDLGERVGMKKQNISNLERGTAKASVDRIAAIADALDCKLDITFARNA